MENTNNDDYGLLQSEQDNVSDEIQSWIDEHDISQDNFKVYAYRVGQKGNVALQQYVNSVPSMYDFGVEYGRGRYRLLVNAVNKMGKVKKTTITWNLDDEIWNERRQAARIARNASPAGEISPRQSAQINNSDSSQQNFLLGMQTAQSMLTPFIDLLARQAENNRSDSSKNPYSEIMTQQKETFRFLQEEQKKILAIERINGGQGQLDEDPEEEMTTKDIIKTVVDLIVQKGAEFLNARGPMGHVYKQAIKSSPEFKRITSDSELLKETIAQAKAETKDSKLVDDVLEKLNLSSISENGASA